jgi:hypothetical protein
MQVKLKSGVGIYICLYRFCLPGSQFSANGFSLGHSIGGGGDQKLLAKSLLASTAAQVGVVMPGERLPRRNLFSRAQVRLIRNDLSAAVCWLCGNVETSFFCFPGFQLSCQVI